MICITAALSIHNTITPIGRDWHAATKLWGLDLKNFTWPNMTLINDVFAPNITKSTCPVLPASHAVISCWLSACPGKMHIDHPCTHRF